MSDEQTFLDSSDNSGNVSFNEVPVGKYTVFVNDEESRSITFCGNYNGDVLAEPLWDITVSFDGRYYDNDWSWEDVIIASSTDELKTIDELNTEAGQEFPFPYEHQYGGKILVDTAFYDDTADGLVLTYYENAFVSGNATINKGYSFDLEYLLVGTEEFGMAGDTHFTQGDPMVTPTWDPIQTSLNGEQEAAYLNHEAFTLHDTGEWINDQGTSSLTITFTPAD